MRLVAVTACPTGIAHTVMAAEALRRQAEVMGHELSVETQGSDGTRQALAPGDIEAAGAVIIAADIYVDPSRFAGKPMLAVTTAEAIRATENVVRAAVAAAEEAQAAAVPEPPAVVAVDEGGDGEGGGGPRRLVAVTSCPTGIAHTFMAAEGLRRAAEDLGHWIKVETQGSVGAKNVLSGEDIALADAVVVAADTKVDLSRFAGKRIYETGTKEALKHGQDVVRRALASTAVVPEAGGADGAAVGAGAAGAGGAPPARKPAERRFSVKAVYQHLMTGVSYMLPLIVAGGLLIAIAFAVDIDANQPDMADSVAGRLFSIGAAAFTLFLPVLAAFLAYSIADRPGLAPGFVGGFLAVQVETGFLGALLAGFLAGYLTRWLADKITLPQTMAGLKPVLILPLLSTLGVGVAMYYVIGEPVSWLQDRLADWLADLQGSNAAVLGAVLGAMMAFDMGGPLNKVAYTFSVGLLTSGINEPMAAVMAAGMTPPLGLALATLLFADRWLPEEREAGKPAWVLGLCFITEGAIPFAARDPVRVIPPLMVGSAVAGAISLGTGTGIVVPHGGIVNLFVPNAIEGLGAWVLALLAGMVVSTAGLFFTKPAVHGARRAAPAAAAAAAG
jgi:PTS system fructose-specific IIC component